MHAIAQEVVNRNLATQVAGVPVGEALASPAAAVNVKQPQNQAAAYCPPGVSQQVVQV